MEFSAKQIAEYIHGEIVGNENAFQTRNIHITYIQPNQRLYWSIKISNRNNR